MAQSSELSPWKPTFTFDMPCASQRQEGDCCMDCSCTKKYTTRENMSVGVFLLVTNRLLWVITPRGQRVTEARTFERALFSSSLPSQPRARPSSGPWNQAQSNWRDHLIVLPSLATELYLLSLPPSLTQIFGFHGKTSEEPVSPDVITWDF